MYNKYGNEYTDCALEEFQAHQDEAKDLVQQRLSTDRDDEDENENQFGQPTVGELHEEVDNDDSFDQHGENISKSHMQPHYFPLGPQNQTLNLMQADAHGNNTDLESITQSNSQLINLPLSSSQPHGVSHGPVNLAHNQSELYKAQQAINQQMMLPTQYSSCFENNEYPTDADLTSASKTPTGAGQQDQSSRMAVTTHETLQTPHQATVSNPPAPVSILEYTEVFVWGEDKYGQLGIDSQLQSKPSESGRAERPDFIPMPRSCSFNIVINQVACGQQHSAILTAQGHLYMMGSNKLGQLGVTSVGPPQDLLHSDHGLTDAQIEEMYTAGSPILVESLKTLKVEQVSCGNNFTMVICRKSLPASEQHATLTPKSEVYGWGDNSHGQLGNTGDMSHVSLPVRQEAFDVLEEEVVQVSCGGSHSLLLTSERDVISCGNNFAGQCGFDPMECSETHTPFKVAAFDSVNIVQVSAGQEHSLYLSDQGQVFASGSNTSLQLGVSIDQSLDKTQTPVLVSGLEDIKVVQIEASFSSACITDKGELYTWGCGTQGDMPFPKKAHIIQNSVIDVSLGRDLGIAVDQQGLAWSWGSNQNGQLGVGDCEPRMHPFPILNLKGKLVTKAHCGTDFVVCLGNNIRKELPQMVDSSRLVDPEHMTNQQFTKHGQPELKKKKILKRKKNADGSKRRTSSRPHTSTNQTHSKFTADNHSSQIAALQKRSRMLDQAKNHSFGPIANQNNLSSLGHGGGSRASSQDRSTSGMRRQIQQAARNVMTISSSTMPKRANGGLSSQERTLSNLQSKYGGSTIKQQSSTKHYSHQPQVQAMQITTMASHEKSRLMTEQAEGLRSPSGTVNQSRPLVQTDYESSSRAPEPDVMKTMKALKNQIKGFKDEAKIMKSELSARAALIEKLERQVQKLQFDDSHQRQVQELQSEIKRTEMKLRKMKERRNYYRSEKDQQKLKINEMQKDNEALFAQITGMQEQSHATREENVSLKMRLQKLEKELQITQDELSKLREKSETLRGQNDQVERQLKSQIRYQETQITDLSGQLSFESSQKNRMAQEIVRLEKLVQSREDYMINLENEAIMLRKEIKSAKFNNEKQGYNGFVGNLTQLRQSRGRSTSNNNRVGADRSTSADRNTITLSNQNSYMRDKQDKSFDDLPQKDSNVNYSHYEPRRSRERSPIGELLSQAKQQQQDARTRLMMTDLHRPPAKNPPFQGLNALKSQTHNASPERQPIQVYQNNESHERNPTMPDIIQCIKSEPEISTIAAKKELKPSEVFSSTEDNQTDGQTHLEVHKHMPQPDQNQRSQNILAVIPLEDSKVYEQSQEINMLQVSRPYPESAIDDSSAVKHRPLGGRQEPLDDNSMVLMQQHSELPTKARDCEYDSNLKKVKPQLGVASCFSEQNKQTPSAADYSVLKTESTARKVSTMIPLGAPKGDGDVRDQYKKMLMAKLDIKTIQKRRRLDQSQER